MYTSHPQQLANGRILRYSIKRDSSPISYAEIINLWQSSPELQKFFTNLLVSSPFNAFRWETPPVTTETAEQPFEFVLLDSPEILLEPNADDFSEYFIDCPPGEIVDFPNLGKDAILLAPCPDNSTSDYGHLASVSTQFIYDTTALAMGEGSYSNAM